MRKNPTTDVGNATNADTQKIQDQWANWVSAAPAIEPKATKR